MSRSGELSPREEGDHGKRREAQRPLISRYPGGREMPIFPLNVVLFPGMPLPLQIFEPRYHTMIERCLDGDRTFGVALISHGTEVGGTARVWPVGATARIEKVEPLSDGKLIVVVRGIERFLVLTHMPDDPYPRAIVTMLDREPDPGAPQDLVEAVQGMLLDLLRRIARSTRQDWGEISLPDDPALLGYMVGAVLPCSLEGKQQLLQARSAEDRLILSISMLRNELASGADADKRTPLSRVFQPAFSPSAN